MKYFIALLIFGLSTVSKANDELIAGLPGWHIVSDTLDPFIAEGETVIQGNIADLSGNSPLKNVRVGTNSAETLTDSLGNFKFTAQVTDTVFYCYLDGWYEIYELNPTFQSKHLLTIKAYLTYKRQLMKKPVIYLYSSEVIKTSIQLKPKGNFTFTYPVYNEQWDIRINKDQSLTDLNSNKEFPYLFWEAETEGLFFDYSEKELKGWVVNRDTCIEFLENQLTALGLNDIEQTDFITFWAPILSQSELNLVQFLVDDEYAENIAEMTITPTPEASRRVYLLMAPVPNSYVGIDVVPQSFQPFERKGFTVVEWGGTEVNFMKIKF